MTTVLGRLRAVEESLKADPLPDDEYVAMRVDHHRKIVALVEADARVEQAHKALFSPVALTGAEYRDARKRYDEARAARATALTALTEAQP